MKISEKRLASLVLGLQSFVQTVSIAGLEMNSYTSLDMNLAL
jgi:hypothetical protein